MKCKLLRHLNIGNLMQEFSITENLASKTMYFCEKLRNNNDFIIIKVVRNFFLFHQGYISHVIYDDTLYLDLSLCSAALFMCLSHTSRLLYYTSCRRPQCRNIGICHHKKEENSNWVTTKM